MTDLSPAAQAVMVAATMGNPNVINDPVYRQCIAAALRAAAGQAIPLMKTPWGSTLVPVLTAKESRDRLLTIATELENHAN